MKTPVAFLIFNRPDTTRVVFERIARARPTKLLVVADGPRSDRPGEAERCAAARNIINEVDWDCEVITHYSEQNLGCRRRVSSGIDWVFDTVEEAIILEDDCLPEDTFFPFCEEMLARYRDNDGVMMVSGTNLFPAAESVGTSYYFSKFANIWGWASWRRAWRHYDVSMSDWADVRRSRVLHKNPIRPGEALYWERIFNKIPRGHDTWDYQWVYTLMKRSGLCVVPRRNQISNIGFNQDATHTKVDSPMANLPTAPLNFPLRHPSEIQANTEADRHYYDNYMSPRPGNPLKAALKSLLEKNVSLHRWIFRMRDGLSRP